MGLEYRMMGLVPYNLSPIQQGIQFGHAIQEYNNDRKYGECSKFNAWRFKHKTFMVMNGGTTRTNPSDPGTMQNHVDALQDIIGNNYATFKEPDLNNALTAVVFLVDERVWDKEKYPEFEDWFWAKYPLGLGSTVVDEIKESDYSKWLQLLGGEQNVKLREFLSQFSLA